MFSSPQLPWGWGASQAYLYVQQASNATTARKKSSNALMENTTPDLMFIVFTENTTPDLHVYCIYRKHNTRLTCLLYLQKTQHQTYMFIVFTENTTPDLHVYCIYRKHNTRLTCSSYLTSFRNWLACFCVCSISSFFLLWCYPDLWGVHRKCINKFWNVQPPPPPPPAPNFGMRGLVDH